MGPVTVATSTSAIFELRAISQKSAGLLQLLLRSPVYSCPEEHGPAPYSAGTLCPGAQRNEEGEP